MIAILFNRNQDKLFQNEQYTLGINLIPRQLSGR